MSGSLLQIVSSGLKDVYLTIDPQITFFKIVFLRHTPFASEVIEETFNIIPNFGDQAFCLLSKNGDLISNMFLKIVIPNVQISTEIDQNYLINNSSIPITVDGDTLPIDIYIETVTNLISTYKIFNNAAMTYWRTITSALQNSQSNYNSIITLINSILTISNDTLTNYLSYNTNFNNAKYFVNNYYNFDILNYILNNFKNYSFSIYNATINANFKTTLTEYLENYIIISNLYYKYLIDKLALLNKINSTILPSNYRFSWVDKLGFALINSLNIEIGGQQIDMVNSDILNYWYSLANNYNHNSTLDNMIGNVPSLTTFDNNVKPSYNLIIPIPFWFCKYRSQAIPCVSLRYHDVIINVKLNELYKCCYFEPTEYNLTSNININEQISITDISLLVEYIQIGTDERKNFGSFTHEYLIEQNQLITFNNIVDVKSLLTLDFYNPIKELVWLVQTNNNISTFKLWNKYGQINVYYGLISELDTFGNIIINVSNSIISNYLKFANGSVKIYNSQYYDGFFKIIKITNNTITIKNNKFIFQDNITFMIYSGGSTDINDIVTIENIQIHGTELLSKRESIYFTLVQNFQHHSIIPDNIHTLSFALNTEDYQPSGSLNLSVIDSKYLYLEMDNDYLKNVVVNNDKIIVKIFARSINILKIEQGMGKLVFSI